MLNKEIFKKKLKYYRLKAGLTQAELAEKMGASRDWIATLESRGNIPSFKYMLQISAALEVPIEYFFSDKEFKNEKILKRLNKLSDDDLKKVFNILEGYLNSQS